MTMSRGLEAVVVTTTRVNRVVGAKGELVLDWYRVEDLAPARPSRKSSTFCGTADFRASELDRLHRDLAGRRAPPRPDARAPSRGRSGRSPRDGRVADGGCIAQPRGRGCGPPAGLLGAFPTILGSYWRLRAPADSRLSEEGRLRNKGWSRTRLPAALRQTWAPAQAHRGRRDFDRAAREARGF